ncbi:MAG: hypothetical protein IJY75_03840, partial [Bacteroidaceae bacterium]|nr:hypothetical protein [Bacteroidaceae bacterium]
IGDDEIRVVTIGNITNHPQPRDPRRRWWVLVLLIIAGIVMAVAVYLVLSNEGIHESSAEVLYLEVPQNDSLNIEQHRIVTQESIKNDSVDSSAAGFTELRDTTINDVPLKLYIPHNAEMSLHIGKIDKMDSTIVYVAQAADVRADNGKIVGAFVLKGEPIAKGLSKRGFCASINGKVTVGVADNSPLFEEAVEKGGYFFRQYPLVDNGVLVENQPKGKTIRRAVCDRDDEILMVESGVRESFHDFAQALVDLGIDNAVYLVGSAAYGWAVDSEGKRHEFGDENIYESRGRRMPKNTSYIVWRKK